MRRRASKLLLALAPILALVACQDPDVGNPCTLTWSSTYEQDGTQPPPTAAELAKEPDGGSDYFESGNLVCDGLVCLVSPAPEGTTYGFTEAQAGYCSKACVSNDDCFEDETGLVCRQMVLDPVFLEQMDDATRARFLAEIQFSSYCAVPR